MSLDSIAAAIQAKIAALSVTGGGTLKAYKWNPGLAGLDSVPAGVVEPPTFARTPVDEPEDHLGEDDWRMEYGVGLFFDLSEAAQAQAQAVEAIEALTLAIDADQTLGGVCQEAKVVSAEPVEIVDETTSRVLLAYNCTVAVLDFV